MQIKSICWVMAATIVCACPTRFDRSMLSKYHTPKRVAHTGPASAAEPPADRIYGVTIDNIEHVDEILPSLRRLHQRVMARIVFDLNKSARDYLPAVIKISQVADISGELVDSYEMKGLSAPQYAQRTEEFVTTLGRYVNIWEIGNEVNGEWTGSSADVRAKIDAAYKIVDHHHGVTALVLYYNTSCAEHKDREMFAWAEGNVSPAIRFGVNYLWLSYYEEDCPGPEPDWNQEFAHLAKLFPNSHLGFGEIGAKDPAKKAGQIQKYYGMSIDVPQFMGGYFWWYFRQDMVPMSRPLWSVFNQVLADNDDIEET
jgi:hypothetical protein